MAAPPPSGTSRICRAVTPIVMLSPSASSVLRPETTVTFSVYWPGCHHRPPLRAYQVHAPTAFRHWLLLSCAPEPPASLASAQVPSYARPNEPAPMTTSVADTVPKRCHHQIASMYSLLAMLGGGAAGGGAGGAGGLTSLVLQT